jgi:histidinol dehydrogenase
VLTRLDLTGRPAAGGPGLAGVLPRAAVDVEAATHLVRPTVEAVRRDGAAAVRAATRQFDGVELTDLRVPAGGEQPAPQGLHPG